MHENFSWTREFLVVCISKNVLLLLKLSTQNVYRAATLTVSSEYKNNGYSKYLYSADPYIGYKKRVNDTVFLADTTKSCVLGRDC